MYDVIVIGATFVSAGIAEKYKEKCLVIEESAQAGYEFFGALDFSVNETEIYPCFQKCQILFSTDLVSVQKTDRGFACVIHGVNGFYTYYAKLVIDTRCDAEMCVSKTYNLLIHSEEEPEFSNMAALKALGENRYVVCCPVPLSCGYVEARTEAQKLMEQFSETQRLILAAYEFDYRVKDGYPKTKDGILYLPSKAYENPKAAMKAGQEVRV